MRSSLRRMTVILFLTVLLAPGLLHARTPAALEWATMNGAASEPGFLSVVWNLLTNLWGIGVTSDSGIKTGGQLDPCGTPSQPSSGSGTTTGGDTGGQLDPSG